MPSRYWVAIAGLALCAAAAFFWYGASAAEPAPFLFDSGSDHEPTSITVHVAGEVVSPGLVEVPVSARIADAVAAAGGSTRNSDLTGVNLAAPLSDGMQVVIPGRLAGNDYAAVVAPDGAVRINLASATELEQLPGVGPVLAARISSYRDKNGPFSAVEDLLDVPGIGEAKLEGLRDAVVLP